MSDIFLLSLPLSLPLFLSFFLFLHSVVIHFFSVFAVSSGTLGTHTNACLSGTLFQVALGFFSRAARSVIVVMLHGIYDRGGDFSPICRAATLSLAPRKEATIPKKLLTTLVKTAILGDGVALHWPRYRQSRPPSVLDFKTALFFGSVHSFVGYGAVAQRVPLKF